MNEDKNTLTFSVSNGNAYRLADWLLKHNIAEWTVRDDTSGHGGKNFFIPAHSACEIARLRIEAIFE